MSAQAVRTWLRSRTSRLNRKTAHASRAPARMTASRMDVVTLAVPFAEDADDTASPPAPFPRQAHDASAGGDLDARVADLDPLAGADLAGLAQLDRAVHAHRAAGHQRLAGPAAVAQAAELEQLVEFDEVAFEGEIDGGHADGVSGCGTPATASGRGGIRSRIRLTRGWPRSMARSESFSNHWRSDHPLSQASSSRSSARSTSPSTPYVQAMLYSVCESFSRARTAASAHSIACSRRPSAASIAEPMYSERWSSGL